MKTRYMLINDMIQRAHTFKPLSYNMYWVVVNPLSVDELYARNPRWGRAIWVDRSPHLHIKPSRWHGFRLYQSHAFPTNEIGFATPPEIVEGDL
jgi:hypothetical protein